jgi:hypothetical protein
MESLKESRGNENRRFPGFSYTRRGKWKSPVFTKAGGIEIHPLSEHQNYNLENVHITTATLVKFA